MQGAPQLPSSERKKRGRDGPYHDTKQHGPPDDPPDFLIPVGSPAPTAKSRQDKVECDGLRPSGRRTDFPPTILLRGGEGKNRIKTPSLVRDPLHFSPCSHKNKFFFSPPKVNS